MDVKRIVWFEVAHGEVKRCSDTVGPMVSLDNAIKNWSLKLYPEEGPWGHNMPHFVMVSEDGKVFTFLDQIDGAVDIIQEIKDRYERRFN